jgi:hypothetical protein
MLRESFRDVGKVILNSQTVLDLVSFLLGSTSQ